MITEFKFYIDRLEIGQLFERQLFKILNRFRYLKWK